MKTPRRKTVIAGRFAKSAATLALALALIVSLAACGGGSPGGSNSSGDAASGGSGASGSSGGGELRIGVAGSLSSLDVNQEAGILNYYIAAIAQEGLVGIANDGEIIPLLAESWDDGGNAEVWTFKLREGITFWDGTPVTADDIVWSIERAADPEQSPGVSIYFPDYIRNVEKTAEDEITITLDGSHASFIWSVSNTGGLFVTSKAWADTVDTIGSPQDLVLGTGPYKPVEFAPGSHVTFEANEDWWNGEPTHSTIRFDFFEDETTRQLAFTQGDIDVALGIPVDQAEQWAKVEGAQVEFHADRYYYGLTFDPGVAPFDDEHVRKAIAYAVDKEGIVSGSVLKGHGQVATAIPSPEQFAGVYSPEEATEVLAGVTHYDYDIDAAKKELAQSGEPDGFETTLFYPSGYSNVGQASLVIADALSSLGITLKVQEIPLDQWLGEVGNGEQGVAWMIYGPTTGEPGEITIWLLDAQGEGYNPANWTDSEAAALTAEVMAAPTFEDQVTPIIEGNSIAQEQAIYQPVWWGQTANAYQSKVTVWDFNSYSLLASNWPQLFKLGTAAIG